MDLRALVVTNYGDWLSKFGDAWKNQIEVLKEKFQSVVEEVKMPPNDLVEVPVVYVKKDSIVEILKFLKTEPGFEYNFLADLTAIDHQTDPRFEVVYNLFSTNRHWRIRVKSRVGENEEVPTAISVWLGANWAEREIYDMFGIKFSGHPDLRRILLDIRWKGHPLRKDYPLRGYQVFVTPEPIDTKLLE